MTQPPLLSNTVEKRATLSSLSLLTKKESIQQFFRNLTVIVSLAAVYFVAGKLGLMLSLRAPTSVWPPTGIALAAFLVLGYRVWPGILLGAFLVNITTMGSSATSFGIAIGNTFEGLFGAYLVNRFANGRNVFDRAQDIFKFTALAGMVSTMVSATVGMTSLALGGFADWANYGSIWITWWLGNVAGALLVAPPLVLWGVAPHLQWHRRQIFEGVLLLLSLFLVGQIVFSGMFPLSFLTIPPLIWAAFRFGQREAATATFVLSGIAIWGTLHGFGPFIRETQNESLLLLQAFMGAVAVMALTIAAVVSERKRAEESLRESQRTMATLLSNLPGYAYRCKNDKDWTLEFISEGVFELTGYPVEDYLVKRTITCGEKMHPDDRDRVWNEVQRALEKRQPFELNYRILTKSNEERWVWERGLGIYSPEGCLLHIEGFVADITESKRAEETIQHLAYYDILTGLPNRNLLHDRLQQAILAGQRENKPVALMLMDLDRFKEVNDTLGHQKGDLLLQETGRRLRNVVGEPDVVARLGGDEFAVLLPQISSEQVSVIVNKVLKALEMPFTLEGISVDVGTSIGIAFFPDHGNDADLLIQRADVAMYAAKQASSGYAVYTFEQDQYSPRRLALMGELRHAIEHEELVLHYQPKIDLKLSRIIGLEALVRWQHPRRGLIPPDQFIPLAERTGLIKPLTEWVLNEVHRQRVKWHLAGTDLPISVNLSARNLQEPQLSDLITELLQISGVAPGWLEMEITESFIMTDPAHAMEILTRLNKMGIRFSIDDFGTGYSSLAYLKRLPVEEIKIDKSFVMDMMSNEDDTVIVLSIINLAHNLSLKVVAEGVESQEIWDRLSAFGCDAAQGYHMARPMPAADLTRWLKESPWGLGQTSY